MRTRPDVVGMPRRWTALPPPFQTTATCRKSGIELGAKSYPAVGVRRGASPYRVPLPLRMAEGSSAVYRPKTWSQRTVSLGSAFAEVYSKAHGQWDGTGYGDTKMLPKTKIINPHIVFFGVTAPDVMMRALRGGNRGDSSLARFLMIRPTIDYPRSREVTVQPIPDSLTIPLRIMAGLPEVEGNLSAIGIGHDTAHQAVEPNLRTVQQSPDTDVMLKAVDTSTLAHRCRRGASTPSEPE
jgi:hypothetical protein